MDVEERIRLVEEVAKGGELINREELKKLFLKKDKPVAYDGFEPSGRLHIAQGILRTINVNKMLKAGIHFKMWVADWFGWMNNKMGGNLDKIRVVGEYQIETWKACGMDTNKIEFLWAKDVMKDDEYWKKVVNIARNNSLNRIIRCSQIMGRSETDNLTAAQIFYPCMQCADIFHLKADITQLGMDQRKVNVLAREIGPKLGFWKPIVVSHHMLMGLEEPPKDAKAGVERATAMKMSKSKPDSAIFMDDSEEEIKRKMKKAYCPEKQVKENPVMEYAEYIVFEKIKDGTFKEFLIERPEKFGGNISFKTYDDLENAYSKGEVHPLDLKTAMAKYLNELIKPVREHFEKDKKAKELLEKVRSYQVTR